MLVHEIVHVSHVVPGASFVTLMSAITYTAMILLPSRSGMFAYEPNLQDTSEKHHAVRMIAHHQRSDRTICWCSSTPQCRLGNGENHSGGSEQKRLTHWSLHLWRFASPCDPSLAGGPGAGCARQPTDAASIISERNMQHLLCWLRKLAAFNLSERASRGAETPPNAVRILGRSFLPMSPALPHQVDGDFGASPSHGQSAMAAIGASNCTKANKISDAPRTSLLARSGRLRRSSDVVRYVRYFCRADEATAMPLDDPQLPSGLTHQCSATLACARM